MKQIREEPSPEEKCSCSCCESDHHCPCCNLWHEVKDKGNELDELQSNINIKPLFKKRTYKLKKIEANSK